MAEEELTESIREETEDRISQLPDCLLVHILSFICLDEALKTCVLSKRWQFVWTGITKVNFWRFRSDGNKIRERNSLEGVGKMLTLCKYFKTFDVCLCYEDFLPSDDVNHWIQLAFRNKVKDISLAVFRNHESNEEEIYELPEEFYSYSSLTKLGLFNCSMAPPRGFILWGSLKSLRIEDVKLSDSLIDKILLGCPVLEFLRLETCTVLENLNISSPNLTKLEIVGKIPNVRAPYLLYLEIDNWYEEGYQHFMLENLSSIVEFNLYAQPTPRDFSTSCKSTMNHVKQILQSLKSVKKIDLGSEYLKVISSLEVEGWIFPLFIQLRCVELHVWSHEMSTIPGILALLRSSPNLEAFEISILQLRKGISSDKSLNNYDMDLVASHLRTVKIILYKNRDCVTKYMLTLVSILLKSAPILEEMTINIEVEASQHDPLAAAKIVERLHTFPRASSKALISFKTLIVKDIPTCRQVGAITPTRNIIRSVIGNSFQTVIRWFLSFIREE